MRVFLALFFMFFSTSTYAANWPSELIFQDKPITECFNSIPERASSRTDPIDLASCNIPDADTIDESPLENLVAQGFTGRAYTFKEFSGIGYGYYKFLGRYRGGFLIYGVTSGGGTGQFSSLFVVKRKGDKIWIERDIAGGDRCNGGITEAWLERGKLFYKINMTPYDIVANADNKTNLRAYDDLESSASSCFAIGTFTQTNENQPELRVISFNQENSENMLSDSDWVRNFRFQPCFNKLFVDSIGEGNASFDRRALSVWVKNFYDVCITQAAIEKKPVEPLQAEPSKINHGEVIQNQEEFPIENTPDLPNSQEQQ